MTETLLLKILLAYGIPPAVVDAIRVMNINTYAVITTPEGNTDCILINTSVHQGDHLAPFLFIICLDYFNLKLVKERGLRTCKPGQKACNASMNDRAGVFGWCM